MSLRLVHSVRALPPLPEPSAEDVAALERGEDDEALVPEDAALDELVAGSRELEGRLPPAAAGRLAQRRERLERVRAIVDAHRRRELGALRLPALLREARQALADGCRALEWLRDGGEPPDAETMARLVAPRPEDPHARLLRRAAAQLRAARSFEQRSLELEEWIRGEREVLVLSDSVPGPL